MSRTVHVPDVVVGGPDRMRGVLARQRKVALRRMADTRVAQLLLAEARAEATRTGQGAERTARARASELWASGARRESLEVLRHHLGTRGGSSATWHVYGARLLELGRGDAAFEAMKTSVDLDPANVDALELLLEMYGSRGAGVRARHEALERLVQHAQERHHRRILGFVISSVRRAELLAPLSESADPVVRAVVQLDRCGVATPEWHASCDVLGLSAREVALCEAIYALGRGRAKTAAALLDKMPVADLPARDIRLAVRRALNADKPAHAHVLLEQYLRATPGDQWAQAKYADTRGDVRSDRYLSRHGFSFVRSAPVPAYRPEPDRVLYTVYNSLPYHSAGYATRTQGLLSSLNAEGWHVRALSRLGYPFDTAGHQELDRVAKRTVIDGVEYLRLDTERRVVARKPLDAYVKAYADGIVRHAREFRPAVIHAASNYANGLASVLAARELGIPSVYEVRGLWEVTRGSRDPAWGASKEFEFMARMETDAACAADRVLTITGALRDELVRRGVRPEKITVVPNGVDAARFTPAPRDTALSDHLRIGDRTVIGYVGSVLDYEGLDLLVEAAAILQDRGRRCAVLIVGDGPERSRLDGMTSSRGLESMVHFAGRVPHDEVGRYYSVIDIAPFPRHALPVCEMVSPLKPFEAMAMGKTVVASDVAALAEIVTDNVTGRLHTKGDARSLADTLDDLLADRQLRRRLGDAGRSWVEHERSWSFLSSSVGGLYRELC